MSEDDGYYSLAMNRLKLVEKYKAENKTLTAKLAAAEEKIATLKNDNEFQEQQLGWAKTARAKYYKSLKVHLNAFDAAMKMEEKVSKKLAAAEEREKGLWDWGKNITNLMPILKNGFEQALNHKPGATKKVESEE